MGERRAEVVHSLAKWKRLKLAEMAVAPGRGIYTDMNALRPDEELDNIHSLYVDQWDWEKVITREQRTVSFLKQTVRRIYEAIKVTENRLYVEFPQIVPMLPEEIRFIHAQRLLDLYPDKTRSSVATGPCSSWASALRCRTDGLTTAARPITTTGVRRERTGIRG